MALTDVAVRRAKPRDKDYKLADGAGLYLLVTPAGGRLWRLKYRIHGVERKLALGRYPDVSLSEARKARDAARRQTTSAGQDPSAEKRRTRIAAKIAVGTTFGAVALEYVEKAERDGRAPATIVKLNWARDWLLPAIGHRPVVQLGKPGASSRVSAEGLRTAAALSIGRHQSQFSRWSHRPERKPLRIESRPELPDPGA